MKKKLTVRQVRSINWPSALKQGRALRTREAYRVGELIVNKVQGPDVQRSRARHPWSLRAIASAIEMSSPATLNRCVQIYAIVQYLKLKEKLDDIPAHLLVASVRIPERRRRAFVNKGLKEGWTKHTAVQRAEEISP